MSASVCPNCGAEVPRNARACPECGSDEKTGWSDEARHDALAVPDEDFDYEEFVGREFGGRKPVPRGIHWFWWMVAVLVVIVFLVFWLR